MVTNEQIWLKQLEKGEDNAFQELFCLFYARLGSFACRLLDEQVMAEDVVQDVLYELWERKLHFENIWALKAYLYNMVRNRCLDVLKHRKVEERYFREQRLAENTEFFFHQLLEDEVYALLQEAVRSLPPQVGKVFELVLDGYDNSAIAELMHLSIDAVKSHKKRGKKILQEKLRGMILFYVFFRNRVL
ncbi:sigma-70 family RNA polymerase sigma factor [Odoribacter sp. N15.MGS-14]|uniref:sigma-70 family RNA polymerase sigma factor n=1 Tax=Odoribacter sp. N15.MGS-14 TaxID=1637502 RepID=UPI000623B579|nr:MULTISPECIES: sigma-70 family RNA polymerase sigma factor [Odoribacter]